MDNHVALAKANLVRAKAQYEAARRLYNSALELQKANLPHETHTEPTIRVHLRSESSIDGAVPNQTSSSNDERHIEHPFPAFCETCKTSLLVTCFIENTWPGSKRLDLGAVSEAVRKMHRCTLCRFLMETVNLIPKPQMGPMAIDYAIVSNSIRAAQGTSKYSWPKLAGCSPDSQVRPFAWLELEHRPRIGVENNATYICIALYPSGETRQDQTPSDIPGPRVRSTNEQSTGLVDYNLLESWVHVCTTYHGPQCEEHGRGDQDLSATPIYLINVRTRRIAAAQPGARYVAVSYVWGDNVSQTSSTSVEPFCGNASERVVISDIDHEYELPERLPQTLEDAIQLTEALGEQFAWIDKYCIDQSNATELAEQIANMDMIYQRAWLTVIALVSEDVNAGIPGVSRPMCSRAQPTLSLPQGKLMATHIEYTREHFGRLPWDQRAWTLQEFVLSRRCLIFSNYHVSMKCQEEFFHDVLPVDTSVHRKMTKLDDETWWENVYAIDLTGNLWDFKTFDGLISTYSGRQLRYQSDILKACQGTLNQITRKTGMGFTFGMPVDDLHRALLWKAHNEVCLQRRTWYEEDKQSWNSFPSWTWAGWQGRTECDYWIGDMAGYSDQDPNDGVKIRNRKGRKRSRMDDSASDLRRQADITSYPIENDMARLSLGISSFVAPCNLQFVRKHDTAYNIFKSGVKHVYTSIGDHWTLVDPDTGYKMRDIAGNEEVFESRDHFFRTDASTSEMLVQAGCKAELLMISHWPLIRDSERSNTWLQDMVSCLVVLRNANRTAWRIAAILLEEEAWKRFDPMPVEIDVV